jgi:hypothetical protein
VAYSGLFNRNSMQVSIKMRAASFQTLCTCSSNVKNKNYGCRFGTSLHVVTNWLRFPDPYFADSLLDNLTTDKSISISGNLAIRTKQPTPS